MDDDFSEFPDTCPLHDCKLVTDTAPIVYGFFTHSPEYGHAWKSRFRQSNAWYVGSCAIGPKTVADIKYCEKCREAESHWLEEQLRDGIDPRCFEWWLAKRFGLVKCTMDIDSDKIDDAVLAVLYLTRCDDKFGAAAWKSHDWDALNRLHAKGYIGDPVSKNKSVGLTEEGKVKAEELFWKLFGKTT